MSGPHRIGLQAAWHAADDGTAWSRSFGRPGIAAGERVWLVIERPAAGEVLLNGRPLPPTPGGDATWRHDVTADLRRRNELRLEVRPPLGPGTPSGRVPLPAALGLVALEIEPAS